MKIATIILNILLLLGLVPAIMGAMTSPMLFDSGQNPNLWRVFITMLALPVVIIICQIVSWIAYFRQKYDFAFRASIIPVINLILLIIFIFSM